MNIQDAFSTARSTPTNAFESVINLNHSDFNDLVSS
jgi:hypothetical protein